MMYVPQIDPPQVAIQSVQSGSCSAPITISPPSTTATSLGSGVAFDDVQAAREPMRAVTASAATRARRAEGTTGWNGDFDMDGSPVIVRLRDSANVLSCGWWSDSKADRKR